MSGGVNYLNVKKWGDYILRMIKLTD